MNIGFFGSPSFAKEIFDAIHERFGLAYAVTQPSKPVGRDQKVTPSAIYSHAKQFNIPVHTPDNLRTFQLPPTDVAVVVAYGKIIPEGLLNQSHFGFFNVHYSLLPRYRGGSPVQFAIINGDRETGTTIFQLTKNLDDGPIAAQVKTTIDSNVMAGQLIKKLTALSIPPLLDLLSFIENNNKPPTLTPQTDTLSYARTLTKDDGFIPFETVKKILINQTVAFGEYPPFIKEQIKKNNITMQPFNHDSFHNFVRGFNLWPIVWTMLPNNKRLRIVETTVKNSTVQLRTVQLEGRLLSTDSKFINRLLTVSA